MGKYSSKAILRELEKIRREEERMRRRAGEEEKPAWRRELEARVPEKAAEGLQQAFVKAFCLIFEKGMGVIGRSCGGEAIERELLARGDAFAPAAGERALRRLKADTARRRAAAVLGSAAEGLGLGLLGVGLPDIALWLGLLLRSICQTALAHGYDWEAPAERFFILLLMEASMQSGEDWERCNRAVDTFLSRREHGVPGQAELRAQAERTAAVFAARLLASKFLQGLPVAGVLGGAADPVYCRRVMRYVQLKYRKRYLLARDR